MDMTEIVILAAFIGLGIYDAWIVFSKGVGSSISRALEKLGFRSPVAMLVIGIIIGHLFFNMRPEEVDCSQVGVSEQGK